MASKGAAPVRRDGRAKLLGRGARIAVRAKAELRSATPIRSTQARIVRLIGRIPRPLFARTRPKEQQDLEMRPRRPHRTGRPSDSYGRGSRLGSVQAKRCNTGRRPRSSDSVVHSLRSACSI